MSMQTTRIDVQKHISNTETVPEIIEMLSDIKITIQTMVIRYRISPLLCCGQ